MIDFWEEEIYYRLIQSGSNSIGALVNTKIVIIASLLSVSGGWLKFDSQSACFILDLWQRLFFIQNVELIKDKP